jgi:sugar phosphate isomerase/epimerase
MPRIPIALQTWSVRDDMKADFARTLAQIAQIGYAGVELAAHADFGADKLKPALDAANLKVAGVHVSYAALRTDSNAIIQDALLLGTKHVIVSWWPGTHFLSAIACQKIGEQLGAVGNVLQAFGLQLSFHNHAGEMKVIDGRTVYDWILSAAAPRDLMAEPDVFWVQHGGQSPAKLLRDLGARCRLIHLKDAQEIGGGPVNFPEIFAVAEEIGAVEWYVVEQEKFTGTPLEGVARSFDQLKKWGKA